MGVAGCATLDHGSDDTVSVVTDPPGAMVSASTGAICVSPCRVVGRRKDPIWLTITKPGFTAQAVLSESKPRASLAEASRNEITADYLGRVIDVEDGSHYEHVPAAVVVKLEPDH